MTAISEERVKNLRQLFQLGMILSVFRLLNVSDHFLVLIRLLQILQEMSILLILLRCIEEFHYVVTE